LRAGYAFTGRLRNCLREERLNLIEDLERVGRRCSLSRDAGSDRNGLADFKFFEPPAPRLRCVDAGVTITDRLCRRAACLGLPDFRLIAESDERSLECGSSACGRQRLSLRHAVSSLLAGGEIVAQFSEFNDVVRCLVLVSRSAGACELVPAFVGRLSLAVPLQREPLQVIQCLANDANADRAPLRDVSEKQTMVRQLVEAPWGAAAGLDNQVNCLILKQRVKRCPGV
jgi:hypothetical protein